MEKGEISKALELLDDAATKHRDDLKSLLKDKFSGLKDALVESEVGMAQKLAYAKQRAVEAATHAKEMAELKAKELAGTIDESVHKNPWAFIGGAAAGAAVAGLLIGYILGRNR